MPMTSKDMERLIPYGWVGSPLSKSTEQSILKQTGLK